MKAATQTAKAKPKSGQRMSNEAVRAKTGKTLPEWFAILDAAGARKMSHKEIVAVLNTKHDVGPWWGQMVTAGYEQERGLREKHQKASGFEISGSKTVNIGIGDLFAAWEDKKKRAKWMGEESEKIEIRKATPSKSMRITWIDGKTSVEANFYPKGEAKSQVAMQHSKLSDGKHAARMKAYWAEKLEGLKELLEQ